MILATIAPLALVILPVLVGGVVYILLAKIL